MPKPCAPEALSIVSATTVCLGRFSPDGLAKIPGGFRAQEGHSAKISFGWIWLAKRYRLRPYRSGIRKWPENGAPENRNRQRFLATPRNRPKRSFGWASTPGFRRRTGRPFPCRLVRCGNTPPAGVRRLLCKSRKTEDIRERFGLESALDYPIGEKLFSFVAASEKYPLFGQKLADFVAEIRRLFTASEIRTYLDHLERTKFLAPAEPDLEGMDDRGDEAEEEPWPDNPVVGAQELLRFSRMRQLLQN